MAVSAPPQQEAQRYSDSGKSRTPPKNQGLVMGSLTTGGGAQVSVPLGFGEQHPTVCECILDAAGFDPSLESACSCIWLPTPQAKSHCGVYRRLQPGKQGPCLNSHRVVLWAASLCRSGLSPMTRRRLMGAPCLCGIRRSAAAQNSSLCHKMNA